MLRKVGADALKTSQRTTRLGPQGQVLEFSPEDVDFRGTPIPPFEPKEAVNTPLVQTQKPGPLGQVKNHGFCRESGIGAPRKATSPPTVFAALAAGAA